MSANQKLMEVSDLSMRQMGGLLALAHSTLTRELRK